MGQQLSSIFSFAWRTAVVVLTVEIAVVSTLRYVANVQEPPPPIVANAFAQPFLIIHVVAGVTALLVGPLQFVRRIRERTPGVHRATGLVYVAACTISAPAAFMLAIGTTAGPVARTGFAIPAVLLPVFTFLGLRAAIEGRFDEHREWMLRSYALTATAITLRIMLPASAFMGYDFYPAYRVIAWLGRTTNLALFEYYIRRSRGSTASYSTLATA